MKGNCGQLPGLDPRAQREGRDSLRPSLTIQGHEPRGFRSGEAARGSSQPAGRRSGRMRFRRSPARNRAPARRLKTKAQETYHRGHTG